LAFYTGNEQVCLGTGVNPIVFPRPNNPPNVIVVVV